MSLLLLDIDNFKTINDQFGHNTGDAALRLISEILRQETRTNDFVGNKVDISASIGLANWHDQDNDIFNLIERADQLMYTAKLQGKNRVVICGDISP